MTIKDFLKFTFKNSSNVAESLIIERAFVDIPNIEIPNKWSFVGGALDEGETPLEGAIRETKEEINFDATDVKLFKEYDDPTIKRYVYVATIDKKISELNLTEGDDMGFFTVEEALKMDISRNTKRYIEEYFLSN